MTDIFETYKTRTFQKARTLAFNVRCLLEGIYPRETFPGAPDYEDGDSGSILIKQVWVALEAYEKEINNHGN